MSEHTRERFEQNSLVESGINLASVFDLAQLPLPIYSQIESAVENLSEYRQLILFAHAGKDFWQRFKASSSNKFCGEHPIDDYSVATVTQFLRKNYPDLNYRILYPNHDKVYQVIGLQQLGELAGWHHPSPMKIGINQDWGTWFAYRLLIICDGEFLATTPVSTELPCNSCNDKPCISQCPAKAVNQSGFELDLCINYRASEHSLCRDRCLARLACPVAKTHQYPIEQIQYHYARSMKIIEQMTPLSDQ